MAMASVIIFSAMRTPPLMIKPKSMPYNRIEPVRMSTRPSRLVRL